MPVVDFEFTESQSECLKKMFDIECSGISEILLQMDTRNKKIVLKFLGSSKFHEFQFSINHLGRKQKFKKRSVDPLLQFLKSTLDWNRIEYSNPEFSSRRIVLKSIPISDPVRSIPIGQLSETVESEIVSAPKEQSNSQLLI